MCMSVSVCVCVHVHFEALQHHVDPGLCWKIKQETEIFPSPTNESMDQLR